MECSGRSRMHDPLVSQSRPRLGCFWGTFSPSRCQTRSTRVSLTSQPAQRSCGSHSGRTAWPIRLRRPSAVPHPLGPAGPYAASSDAARAPHKRGARRHANDLGHAQCRLGGARGLEVSPGSLLQNELIKRQIGNSPAKSVVLCLEILQPLHLISFEPTELLAPAIVRDLAHTNLADRVNNALALRDQNVNLPQLRDNLLRLVPLPRHIGPP